jgi:hypothetical protein
MQRSQDWEVARYCTSGLCQCSIAIEMNFGFKALFVDLFIVAV